MTVAQITNEALALPLSDRRLLAHRLWDSVNEESSPELDTEEQDLLDEAQRRCEELDSGKVAPVSHEEVMAALNKIVRCD